MPADNFTYNPPNVVMLSVCQLSGVIMWDNIHIKAMINHVGGGNGPSIL
jgi:hypothetical protein